MTAPLKHPRLRTAVRKTGKWGGPVVTVVLVAVWIGSGWRTFVVSDGVRYFYVLGYGQLGIYREADFPPGPSPTPAWKQTARFQLNWRFDRLGWPEFSRYLIPLWIPPLFSLFPTAFAWRADSLSRRRARAGHCPACDYDRSGLATGAACPECGAAASA